MKNLKQRYEMDRIYVGVSNKETATVIIMIYFSDQHRRHPNSSEPLQTSPNLQQISQHNLNPVPHHHDQYIFLQVSQRYQTASPGSLPPHIFGLAANIFRSLVAQQSPQCCVISGESGAGKTESRKFLLQHLLTVALSGEGGLVAKIQRVDTSLMMNKIFCNVLYV